MKYLTCKNMKQFCPKLMITYNILAFFAKKSWLLLLKHQFLYFYHLKRIFTKVWTISAHSNEEISIKHGKKKKKNVTFMKSFSGLFCINISWFYGNLNIKYFLWWYSPKYIQNSWKRKVWSWNSFYSNETSFNLRNLWNDKKLWNSALVPRPQNTNFSHFWDFRG